MYIYEIIIYLLGMKILIIIMILMLIKYYYLKSDNKYFVRNNDVNKKKNVPLSLKINNFSFGELDIFGDNIAEVVIESSDEEFFHKM